PGAHESIASRAVPLPHHVVRQVLEGIDAAAAALPFDGGRALELGRRRLHEYGDRPWVLAAQDLELDLQSALRLETPVAAHELERGECSGAVARRQRPQGPASPPLVNG